MVIINTGPVLQRPKSPHLRLGSGRRFPNGAFAIFGVPWEGSVVSLDFTLELDKLNQRSVSFCLSFFYFSFSLSFSPLTGPIFALLKLKTGPFF